MSSVQFLSNGNDATLTCPADVAGSGNLTFMGWLKFALATEENVATLSFGLGVAATTWNATGAVVGSISGPDTNRRVVGTRRGTNNYAAAMAIAYASTNWVYVVLHLPTSGNATGRFFADDSGLTLLGTLTMGTGAARRPFVAISGARTFRTTGWKVFDGGSFTDAECRAQAATRDAVAHGSATLRDRWVMVDHTARTGLVDGQVIAASAQASTTLSTNADEPAALTAAPAVARFRPYFTT
jgi:hypothetical protein